MRAVRQSEWSLIVPTTLPLTSPGDSERSFALLKVTQLPSGEAGFRTGIWSFWDQGLSGCASCFPHGLTFLLDPVVTLEVHTLRVQPLCPSLISLAAWVCLSICVSVSLQFHVCVSLSVCIYVFLCVSMFLSMYLSFYVTFWMYLCLTVFLCLFVSVSLYLCICLFLCVSVCLPYISVFSSVCLVSVCLCVSVYSAFGNVCC